jgi:hypothetical protein
VRLIGPNEGDLTSVLLRVLVKAILEEANPGPCYFWWWSWACVNIFDRDAPRDFLFRGRVRDLPRFVSRKKATSPTYWWPQTRAWCVATDWDSCFTVMGGSESLVRRVLGSPEVEGLAIGPEDDLRRP